jgi:cystathionine gamma-synthase
LRPETLAIHGGYSAHGPNQSINPPLHTSTVWTHPDTGLNRGPGSTAYSRFANPNRNEFESVMCGLEGGETAMAFGSGIAAIAAIFQALDPGDHVVVCQDVYHGTRVLLNGFLKRWGLTATFADATNSSEFVSHVRPETKLLWLETPSNPLLLITDIRAIRALVPDRLIAVDNTWATPIFQRPLELGADVVMHSASKYLGGHSDILNGAVVCKTADDFSHRIRSIQQQTGGISSPFDSWMLVRSIKTLPVRMKAHEANALAVANFLNDLPSIETVYYPGLPTAQGYDVVLKQMSGFGAMVSFLFMGNQEQTLKGIAKSRLIHRATSLGGVESTWEHRLSSEGEGSPTPPNLVRLSVGLEHIDDLIQDLEQALA